VEFHYTLLENGLDFVLSSLDYLTQASGASTDNAAAARQAKSNNDQKRYLKYALLHLCSGVELIFKERLRQENWELVFADRDEADKDEYEAGDFRSVDFKEAQRRLKQECGIKFTRRQTADLRNFRRRRNQVEHFGAEDTLLAVQSSTTQMVSFLIDFVEQAFDVDGLVEEDALLSEVRAKLGNCRAVVNDRLTLIQSDIKKRFAVVHCSSCRQKAMSADGGTAKCLFCHFSADADAAAEEYVETILGYPSRYEVERDGGEWPVRTCNECGSDTFVAAVPSDSDTDIFYCFNCGTSYHPGEAELCHDCGRYYPHGEDAGSHICSKCFKAMLDRYD
jgi:hypothetical protein